VLWLRAAFECGKGIDDERLWSAWNWPLWGD
jgi:hypothetical protein